MAFKAQLPGRSRSRFSTSRTCPEHLEPCCVVLLAALSTICLMTSCSRPNSASSETVRPSRTASEIAENALDVRSFPGKIDVSKQAELAFQVPGVLVHLPVKEGQGIAKGEIIAQLRLDGFRARLEAAQGQLDQARAALKALRIGKHPEEQLLRETQERVTAVKLANARAEFQRYAQLIQSGAVSISEYQLAETNYRVAQEDHQTALQLLDRQKTGLNDDIEAQEAQVRALSGLVAEAKLRLEDGTLRAPYDGVVAQRFVDEGQSITANKPVVRFQSVETIDIIVDLSAAAMTSDIRSRNIVGMLAEISGVPGRKYPVHITEVAQAADQTAQTFPVRFQMKTPPGFTIFPGTGATVIISYRRR